jgi:glycerol-3-phosphate dehydrogenase (NAD(P)+)
MTMTPVIIGGGSWGYAIASALIRTGQHVELLVRRQATVDALAAGQCMQLPDAAQMPPMTASLAPACLQTASMIFVVVPVAANPAAFDTIATHGTAGVPVILCAKGISSHNGQDAQLLTHAAQQALPDHPIAVFSGPSFADEVLAGLPAALVAASTSPAVLEMIQTAFQHSNIRVYTHNDPDGLALAGAMKNVVAIAAGCAVGLGLGDNAKAAIITRGLAEIARLNHAIGGDAETIFGLGGVGDLALSCAGPHSRNMAFGLALGAGDAVPDKLAEGSRTVAALALMGRHKKVDLPITNAIDMVLNHGQNLDDAVKALLARRAGTE